MPREGQDLGVFGAEAKVAEAEVRSQEEVLGALSGEGRARRALREDDPRLDVAVDVALAIEVVEGLEHLVEDAIREGR
jgi:hypothetical protein